METVSVAFPKVDAGCVVVMTTLVAVPVPVAGAEVLTEAVMSESALEVVVPFSTTESLVEAVGNSVGVVVVKSTLVE